MDLQNTFKSKTSFYTCIIFIIFTTLANQTQSLDPKFEACVPRACGKGPNISYPFWILGEQDSFCGYPNFEITCKDKNPVLNISSDEYIIKDIFYANYSFHVANAAVYEDTCPTPLHNISLDRTPFSFCPTHTNFFFLYNCTEKPEKYFTYPVNCASNATHYSFAGFHETLLESTNYSLGSCQSFVNVPVDMSGDLDSLSGMNYTDVLEMGFLLNWTAHSCSNCERSGGRCGYDNNEFVCFCQDQPHLKTCDDGNGMSVRRKLAIGLAAGGIGMMFMCIIFCCFRRKITSMAFFRKTTKNDQDLEAFIRSYGTLFLKRYSFSSVKEMTNSFKDKIGQGGYGGVYKGKLLDGRLVAVKVLNISKGNGEEFINEVASISRTSHVNIVTLLGFCLEGRKRALIYEFMLNGSLEKFIYNDNTLKASQHLGWEKLYQIAIGIARGLEYLHRGCNTRIVHFDIKPHNILLDEEFCPKISDFGLAKLCTRKESMISMLEARGTIGYIAPEVFCRNFGGVSHRSDVYSYGMMVLEMVGGRKNIDVGVNHTSEIYFPHWIYKRLELGTEFELHDVTTVEETEIVRKMILVGLWCIQTNPSDRPSMSKVIEMLEGSAGALEIPPRPFLSSPRRSPPPRSPNSDSSTTSLS